MWIVAVTEVVSNWTRIVTDWSKVEFTSTSPISRKAGDILPIIAGSLLFWDFFTCVASGEIALKLYGKFAIGQAFDAVSIGSFVREIVFGSAIASLILRTSAKSLDLGLHSLWSFVYTAEQRCFWAFAVLIAVGLATRATDDLARLWLFGWFFIYAAVVGSTRTICGWYLKRLSGRGELRESIAIVGAAAARNRLAARIGAEADVIGMFSAGQNDDFSLSDSDDLASLLQLGRDGTVDSIILALEEGQQSDIAHILQRLKSLPVQVAVCSDAGWSGVATPHMRLLAGLPMTVVADRPLKPWDILAKAVFDKLGAVLLLILLSPLLLAVMIAVGLTSPGPIIFRQDRQGWCSRSFVVFKFRTMRAADMSAPPLFQTLRHDARCTRVGRVLRCCSLDELPQLWNVLRGEMSLVGPRPHADNLHDFDRAGREIVADYAQRHRVKPGITGWAQVHGARGATATLEQLRRRVAYDLYYIENWSLLLDLRILLRTPFCMTGENAF